MKSRRQRQRKHRSARRATKIKSRNSRRRCRTLRGGKRYSLKGLDDNDQRTTFLINTGLIKLVDGEYRPTDTLVTFLNTDIPSIRNYNYVKLNTNDTDYTLSKEALPRQGWDTPIKLQIKTTNNNANYGDPIPVQVDD